ADLVDRDDPVRDGVAQQVEPAPAAVSVDPALGEDALRVVAHVEVIGPGGIVGRLGVGARDMRLAAIAELDLVALAAPRAGDEEHLLALVGEGPLHGIRFALDNPQKRACRAVGPTPALLPILYRIQLETELRRELAL